MPATASTTYAERVDRERRKYEQALYLYLLGRLAQAARHAVSAARHGLDPAQAATDAILGNEALDLPGIADGMTSLLETAYDAGWRRAGRTAGLNEDDSFFHVDEDNGAMKLDRDSDAREFAAGRAKLAQQARDYAASVAESIANGLRGALGGVTGGAKATVSALRGWFRRSGYVASDHADAVKPSKTHGAAVTHAVSAYNQGNFAGFRTIGTVLGWLDTAVLDDNTTEVCEACDGIRLPIEHPFWRGRYVPRHFNCRTIMTPLFEQFHPTPDERLPWHLTSAPGFGNGGVSSY